jgi:hypothetical protein
MIENFATKQDIKISELAFRSEMKEEFSNVRSEITELRYDIQSFENRMTLKLSGKMIGIVALSQVLNKLI